MRDIHVTDERRMLDWKSGPTKGDRKELFTIVRFNYLACLAPLPQRRMNKEFNYKRSVSVRRRATLERASANVVSNASASCVLLRATAA